MFSNLLIANRGEIACRIGRTARRLGMRVVAVHSEADTHALHVTQADESHLLGPAPARESYLRGDAIVAIAKQNGVEAIHPGYGFLSENSEFAQACADAGITFVGPPVSAIEAMGSKSGAKAIMGDAGVPLVPGYHGDDQSLETLAGAAEDIGYPVLLKASAGGGGKGMRIVENAADFSAALDSAKREAAASFGDDRMLVEKYLLTPRHVEIQVFADTHGNVVHLYERDCSVQRRHQKVIEEAPAPGLSDETRTAMGDAAVAAARAIGYVGAGTVEFILDARGTFYFMEMNTRLQVEHPVTEMITGTDLVEWQLRVASGEPLPLTQSEIPLNGHAFEVRLYAEDPARGYLPSIGHVHHFAMPDTGPIPPSASVRVDTGVASGDEISINYDPMIAKLIVHGPDRASALAGMRRALSDVEVIGVATNTALLSAVAAHPDFMAGPVDTGFLERENAALLPETEAPESESIVMAALGVLALDHHQSKSRAVGTADETSPWRSTIGWRLNQPADRIVHLASAVGDGEVMRVTVRNRGRHAPAAPGKGDNSLIGADLLVAVPLGGLAAEIMDVAVETGIVSLTAQLEGRRVSARIVFRGGEIVVYPGGRSGWGAAARFYEIDPLASAGAQDVPGGALTAPMPGRIVTVMVEAGAEVTRGTPLLVLEAMKMEHTIEAPTDGIVRSVAYAPGDLVGDGDMLVDFEAVDAA